MKQHKFTAPAGVALASLLLLLTAWVYWPGITGLDLLDDRSSILVVGDLKDKPDQAMDYIFGDRSGLLGRSVSMTTFVLEKLFVDEGIAGNKRFNIILHLLNGSLVIWLFWMLFRFQAIPGYSWLAIVLGAIWLLHPLWVSTVLYVVQRMAMLSTFFMLLASVSYVYWRQSLIAGKGGLLRFLPVPVLLIIGLLAKENAIVLVPIVLVMEVLWFRFAGSGGQTVTWLRNVSYGLIASGAAVMLSILVLRWDRLAAKFHRRSFSMEERLLTESRIVWDYVAQLFRPQVGRMGIYHEDVVLSRSLLEPVTTLYALVAWALLVFTCCILLRWQAGRWLVFGIAWFLLGHSVESTLLPLELYFEHRNYYPAVGLVLAVGSLVAVMAKKWPEARTPLIVCLSLTLLPLSALTSSQVQIWSNRYLLTLNHINGHPNSPRANIDMAVQLAQVGEIDAARDYSKRAHEAAQARSNTGERSGDREVRDLALYCIAQQAPPAELIDNLGKQDPQRPLSLVVNLLTMVKMLQDNTCPQFDRVRFADRMTEIYLVDDFRRKASANIYANLAVLENALQRYEYALAYTEQLLAMSPNDKRGLLMKLHFATALGRPEEAEKVIARLQQMDEQGSLTVGEQQTLALYLEN